MSRKKLPNQFFNVTLTKYDCLATGLALEGKKVVTYHWQFSYFQMFRATRNDACYHNVNVIDCSLHEFRKGQLGYSHHATNISIARSLPNTTVVAPCSDWEAKNAIKILVNDDGVGYLRLDKTFIDSRKYRQSKFNLYRQRYVTKRYNLNSNWWYC